MEPQSFQLHTCTFVHVKDAPARDRMCLWLALSAIHELIFVEKDVGRIDTCIKPLCGRVEADNPQSSCVDPQFDLSVWSMGLTLVIFN